MSMQAAGSLLVNLFAFSLTRDPFLRSGILHPLFAFWPDKFSIGSYAESTTTVEVCRLRLSNRIRSEHVDNLRLRSSAIALC